MPIENKSRKQNKKQIDDIEAIKTVMGSNYRPTVKKQKSEKIENIFIKQKAKKK